jgi:hypothetical protein
VIANRLTGIPEDCPSCGHLCSEIPVTFSLDWAMSFGCQKVTGHCIKDFDEKLRCLKGMEITADRTFKSGES